MYRRKRHTITTLLAISFAVAGLWLSFAPPLRAQNDAAIAQSFQADSITDMVAGALLSLKNDNSQTVQLATAGSADQLVGVVSQNPLLALSKSSQKATVQAVTNGITTVLVSDMNGSVRAGDKITASPIAGVGMLATESTQIIGTAQAALNTKNAATQTITDRGKKTHTVRIAQVPVQVSIAFYQQPTSNFLPPFLQSLANSVAGRPVSLIRILLCAILLLAALVSIAILLYTSIRASITSIGRNPLAASAIRRGLLQVGGVTVMILVFSLLASYVALTV